MALNDTALGLMSLGHFLGNFSRELGSISHGTEPRQKSHGKFPWTGSNMMDHNDWNNSMHIV